MRRGLINNGIKYESYLLENAPLNEIAEKLDDIDDSALDYDTLWKLHDRIKASGNEETKEGLELQSRILSEVSLHNVVMEFRDGRDFAYDQFHNDTYLDEDGHNHTFANEKEAADWFNRNKRRIDEIADTITQSGNPDVEWSVGQYESMKEVMADLRNRRHEEISRERREGKNNRRPAREDNTQPVKENAPKPSEATNTKNGNQANTRDSRLKDPDWQANLTEMDTLEQTTDGVWRKAKGIYDEHSAKVKTIDDGLKRYDDAIDKCYLSIKVNRGEYAMRRNALFGNQSRTPGLRNRMSETMHFMRNAVTDPRGTITNITGLFRNRRVIRSDSNKANDLKQRRISYEKSTRKLRADSSLLASNAGRVLNQLSDYIKPFKEMRYDIENGRDVRIRHDLGAHRGSRVPISSYTDPNFIKLEIRSMLSDISTQSSILDMAQQYR